MGNPPPPHGHDPPFPAHAVGPWPLLAPCGGPVPGFERRRLPLDEGPELTPWAAPELGNSSYLLWVPGSSGAAVTDPVRDLDGYLTSLPPGPRRKTVAMETHLRNDLLSGSRELQKREGAEIALSAASRSPRGRRDPA